MNAVWGEKAVSHNSLIAFSLLSAPIRVIRGQVTLFGHVNRVFEMLAGQRHGALEVDQTDRWIRREVTHDLIVLYQPAAIRFIQEAHIFIGCSEGRTEPVCLGEQPNVDIRVPRRTCGLGKISPVALGLRITPLRKVKYKRGRLAPH